MRVVLDTNILISALLSPSGPPASIIDAWRARRFDLVTGNAQVEEFRRATRYPLLAAYISRAEAGVLVNGLRRAEVFLKRLPDIGGSADPDDDFLLALAVAGKADFLVTGTAAGCSPSSESEQRESSPPGGLPASCSGSAAGGHSGRGGIDPW